MPISADQLDEDEFSNIEIEIPDDVPEELNSDELSDLVKEPDQEVEPEQPKSKRKSSRKDKTVDDQLKEKDKQIEQLQARLELEKNLRDGTANEDIQKELVKKEVEISRLKTDLKKAMDDEPKIHTLERQKAKASEGLRGYVKALLSSHRSFDSLIVTCCVIYSMFTTGLLITSRKGLLKDLKDANRTIGSWMKILIAWHNKAAGWTKGFIPDPAMRNVAGYIIIFVIYGSLITLIVNAIRHFKIRLIDRNYLFLFLTEILMLFMLFLIIQTWHGIRINTMLLWLVSIPICFVATEIFFNKK